MTPLPIDPLIPEVVEQLKRARCLVLEAPPGAGKTTRVPPALQAFGHVVVLEPRRLAARMAARRVATERGERVGETVGYQVRFEEVSGPRTRLRFVTEGVLTRRLVSDPKLRGVDVVVLDEFHERRLDGDLALALLRRLQAAARPDLRLVVMSATLNATPVAEFLGGCPVLRSQGRLFDLAISYTPHSSAALEEQVAAALDKLQSEGIDGDVLVFLPGAAEIRRAASACEVIARRAGWIVLPLHGDLSPEEQDCAVQPAARSKLILSTNVAESSVTIEGVRAVIDSGLARVAEDSPWSGLPSLRVSRVSQASATQRAGRAGRTGPGRAIRLYTEEDFHRRAAQDPPDILRRELSQTVLDLRAIGVRELAWLDAPPEAALGAAEELLRRLGALSDSGELTPVGQKMAGLPLHPRLARLVLEAERRGAGEGGCAIAAALSVGERLADEPARRVGPSDLLVLAESAWQPRTARVFEQIRRLVRPKLKSRHEDEALLIPALAAFPDRVARRRANEELMLAGGGSARLSRASVVRQHELLVAVDIEERRERGLPLVRLASGIEAEWLLDLFPDRLAERAEVEWNRPAERAEAVSALLYDGLVIQESRGGAADPEAASRLLAAQAREAGVERFTDAEELREFLARVAFASQHAPVPALDEAALNAALESLCAGRRSFAELRSAAEGGGFLRALEAQLPAGKRQLLDRVAPERLRLPNGRTAQVHYSAQQPPWLASRLQDFFGWKETPRVANGQVPVVLHLLAPNQRPVQMTTDLAGFWQRLYPQLRTQLSRRYPKHSWPEKP